MNQVLIPVLAGCAGFALGMKAGNQDTEGNAVLYWLLVAVMVLGVLGGGLLLFKKVRQNG